MEGAGIATGAVIVFVEQVHHALTNDGLLLIEKLDLRKGFLDTDNMIGFMATPKTGTPAGLATGTTYGLFSLFVCGWHLHKN
jgi:hypothetical protein